MAFARPTLPTLIDRIQADLVSRLALVGAVLRRSFVYVLARVLAGAAHMMHGHLEFLGRQLFPDQSEGEFLERQAALFGITRTPPTFASATALVTGDAGTEIPAGTEYRSAAGYTYETTEDVTLPAVGGVEIEATEPGSESSLVEGAIVTLSSPIAGVDSAAEIDADPSDGTDEETTEALRARVLERLASEPHGGTEADYVAWAKEVPGVTRAWVFPLELGPGTVLVRFTRDNDASPIPDAGEVTAVQTYLDEQKPAHASVTAAAPVAADVDVEIELTPDTSDIRDAVEAALADFFIDAAPGDTIVRAQLQTAIGNAAGVVDFELVQPAANVTHAAHELPTLGAITWS